MNNDRSHIHISYNKVEETKVVQEKRQIDKIMHGIIKERLFSHFIDEDTRTSEENYMKITRIGRKGFLQGRFRDRHRHFQNIGKTI
jgi:predicted transcriptional regulator